MTTLILACCAKKLDHPAAALRMYRNRAFDLVRKNYHDVIDAAQVRVLILSAKHGLIDSGSVIEPYEQPMTNERKVKLARILAKQLHSLGVPSDDELVVYGGAHYRELVNRAVINRANHVTELVGRNRGNGDHYAALKRWIDRLELPHCPECGGEGYHLNLCSSVTGAAPRELIGKGAEIV